MARMGLRAGVAGALVAGALMAPAAHAGPGYDAYSVRISPAQLHQLQAAGIDLNETRLPTHGTARVPVVLTAQQAKALRAKGIATRLEGRTKRTKAAGYTVYRTYSEPGGIADEIRALARQYPKITELVTLGRTLNGQPILALRVTKNAAHERRGKRPSVLYMATQHAREWIAAETDRRLMHYFVEGYATNKVVKKLVDSRELWFVPVANPDGYDYTFTPGNRLWRKNLRDVNGDGVIEAGVDGVDLNRNFPTYWNQDDEGSNTDTGSDTYRGTAPLSEPETRAFERLFRELRFEAVINYHSAAELLLYPFGNEVDLRSDDDPVFEALSGTDGPDPASTTDDDSAIPGYDPDLGAELYTTNGETTDHLYVRYGTLAWTPELDTASAFGATGVSDFEFPDDEAKIQQVFEKNIPFALNVATSAANLTEPENSGASIPGEYQVKATPSFVVDKFGESYGTPQLVEVNAKRSLGDVTLKYRLNGRGPTYTLSTREYRGGERYGEVRGQYYHRLRATIRDLKVGDSVEVWWQARKAKSESFTFKVVYDAKGGRNGVLLLATEDYTGNSPGTPYAGPRYLDAHLVTLRANGIDPVVYDVDAKGRVAPHPLGVLSHFNAVVWYSGDDVIPRDPTQGAGTASKIAHDEIVGIRDFLNEGGRVFASGKNLPYAHMNGYPYPPGPTAPVPLTDDVFQYYFGAYRYQAGLDIDKFAGLLVQPFGSIFGFTDFTPDDSAANPSQLLHTESFLPRATYPDFASAPLAKYQLVGKQREEPIEGDYQAYASHDDEAWKRLTRTIDVPAGTTTFDFQASWDVEQDYDFVIVEVHTVNQDNWTTLPEVGGHAVQTLGSCEIAWDSVHPWVDRYQTFDPATATCQPTGPNGAQWWGLTGDSAGWDDLHYDLSAYAGQQVEISISYVTDFAVSGIIGVQIDDVRLTNNGVATPITGFETGDLDGFATPAAPEGSPNLRSTWVATGTIDLPGEEAAGVVTTDTVLLPFGLEQITDTAIRDDIVGDAMRWLLRADDDPPPPSGS